MRKTSNTKHFPFASRTTCLLLCRKENILQIGHNMDISPEEAYDIAKKGDGQIIAIWPGEWRSDAFIVDNLEQFATAFGFGPLPDTTWRIIAYRENPTYSTNITKCIEFDVNGDIICENFETVARVIEKQFGWNVAMSKGFSCHGLNNDCQMSVYIHRNSIDSLSPNTWHESDGNYQTILAERKKAMQKQNKTRQ